MTSIFANWAAGAVQYVHFNSKIRATYALALVHYSKASVWAGKAAIDMGEKQYWPKQLK